MPSRRTIAFIVAFWVATMGYVAYRDVWPRLFASGPPPVFIDLADEAAQSVPVRWTVSRNGQRAGTLVTSMHYEESDDTFWFTHNYRDLKTTIANVTIASPKLNSDMYISRDGNLIRQRVAGTFVVSADGFQVFEATVKVDATVNEGHLTATAEVTTPFTTLSKTLAPVPVPAGQPLNPLQPVNRIAGLKAGQRWVVHEFNPFEHVTRSLVQQVGGKDDRQDQLSLVAEVQREPRDLDRKDGTTPCWVIEYRREEVVARTWVRVSDGKVMKQEAFHRGEHLSLDREE